jgi:preprotein translocase subunit YajC
VQGSGLESLLFLGLLITLFYFMLIRPQKRRVQAHQKLVQSVGVGDEVITIGGEYGIVRTLTDDSVLLEVAPGCNIKYVRSAISRIVQDDEIEETTTEVEG